MTTTAIITPIILCGGKGTRLWPMSRSARPKQFLKLMSDWSQYQKTLLRVADPSLYAPPVVITNAEYRFLVAEQAEEAGVKLAGVLLEPMPRNTTAAIAAGVIFASADGGERLVHILPSDHEIVVDDAYRDAVRAAAAAAAAGGLVTFGITPSEPATGFGYIRAGAPAGEGALEVDRFVEKPDRARAEEMIAAGNHYWNSGMFLFSTSVFLAECRTFVPAVVEAVGEAVKKAARDLDFIRLDEEAFAASPDISVDYAIFEKTTLARVVPTPIRWSDLGSWDAVWEAGAPDAAGNVARGPATVRNAANTLVISDRLHVALTDLDDVAVIATEDAVLVGRLSKAQEVGGIVKALQANAATRELTETHRTSYRPWGGYSSLATGERFQVKRLFVKPGKRLSLQKHHHRAEHWVVVRGIAEVVVGDETKTVNENESVYIPLGAVHRLANPGKILLEVIEVQSGSYLGEDDIVRLDDEFGRK
ncbi:MAG: mannose-1-phosphate guanylyltransferase/mannose-6-phosphate isomerase [Rhizobiaceae bacterium]